MTGTYVISTRSCIYGFTRPCATRISKPARYAVRARPVTWGSKTRFFFFLYLSLLLCRVRVDNFFLLFPRPLHTCRSSASWTSWRSGPRRGRWCDGTLDAIPPAGLPASAHLQRAWRLWPAAAAKKCAAGLAAYLWYLCGYETCEASRKAYAPQTPLVPLALVYFSLSCVNRYAALSAAASR